MPKTTVTFEHLKEAMNDVSYRLMYAPERNIIQQGGAGSGKSWGTADWIHQLMFNEVVYGKRGKVERAHNFLIVRKVATTLRLSTWKLMNDTIARRGTSKLWDIKEGSRLLTCANGARLNFLGLDDPEKLKSIEGITGIWFEEATEGTLADHEELNRRLRGITPFQKRRIYTFNPISVTSPIHELFYKNKVPNTRIVKTTWRNNRFLCPEDTEVLSSYKPGSINDLVYSRGEWGVLEGLIYNAPIMIDTFPDCDEVCYGLDFGFTNPMSLTKTGFQGRDRLFLQQMIYETQLTERDLLRRMAELGISRHHVIWADSEAPGTIRALQEAGYDCRPVDKSIMGVTESISLVKDRIIYLTQDSPDVLKEFQSYQWDYKADGTPTDKPIKKRDHAMDGIRYPVMMVDGKKTQRIYIA